MTRRTMPGRCLGTAWPATLIPLIYPPICPLICWLTCSSLDLQHRIGLVGESRKKKEEKQKGPALSS